METHHGVDAHRLAVHVLHVTWHLPSGRRHGSFLVRRISLSCSHQLVGQHDRQRHQFFGLVAGIAEHQALVAGAAGVHAHGDVGRLRLNQSRMPQVLPSKPYSALS